MGTLAEAGRSLPVRLHLGDFSPFAALSSAFRAATKAEISDSIRLAEISVQSIVAADERVFFSELFCAIGAGTHLAARAALAVPTESRSRSIALAMYIAALSRIRLYKRFAGSNPTWVKRANVIADADSARLAFAETLATAETFAAGLVDRHPKNETHSHWASVMDLALDSESLDAIITSPPYPNRTDYLRHYLPASELLLDAAGKDERAARIQQIGTPLIREKSSEIQFPPAVIAILDQIRTHGSYASERYYYKGFQFYFADIAYALARFETWLRPGGLLLIVVQDTYYKNIHVPTADLMIELAEACGFTTSGRQDWRVSQRLSQLSPHSRKSLPNRLLNESIIAFNK